MDHLTCCSSFSNVDAKVSIGPRTAYSVFLMFGLSVSMVRSLLAMFIFVDSRDLFGLCWSFWRTVTDK